ncbi:hypothetical protein Dsin_030710 [Dipteronia sinensis]|uniref:Uncharacterized protein n=1 Tax=Dipteronia sinensis TaxID=43782 RepID=A0AAE0DRL4_9ROSI|nr:hypothetical protein Dsin_030710 [Dipteronia sinensis]
MTSNFEIDRLLDSSSSDDDLEMIAIAVIARRRKNKSKCGGSIDGHTTIWRDRLASHERLYHDYFSETPTYSLDKFRIRFRMNRYLFICIKNSMEQ